MSPGTRRQFGAGIAQLFCALSVLSLLDVTGKKMIGIGVSVLMVGWFRYLSHLLIFCTIALPLRGRRLFLTQSLSRQATRGVLVALTTITFFSVLKRLPLAEATALNFLAPVMVLIASPWVLGEPLRWRHALGVLLGFGGMLIVIRPGGALPIEGVLLGLLSAVILAAFQIATRRVAADDPITTNAYSGGLWDACVHPHPAVGRPLAQPGAPGMAAVVLHRRIGRTGPLAADPGLSRRAGLVIVTLCVSADLCRYCARLARLWPVAGLDDWHWHGTHCAGRRSNGRTRMARPFTFIRSSDASVSRTVLDDATSLNPNTTGAATRHPLVVGDQNKR